MAKIKILIIFLLPLVAFTHEQDEALFSSSDVPPGAIILLDRSGSMGWDSEVYDTTLTVDRTTVRLSAFNHNHSTHSEGWYDEEIWPDGPGVMSDFNQSPADDIWTLTISGDDWWGRDTAVVSDWKLRFYSGGSYTEFDGGSISLGPGDWSESDNISVSGVGTVDSVECYVNINTYDYRYWSWGRWRTYETELGNIEIDLEGPALVENIERLTRIQIALEVIHSLLDANGDGFVTTEDENFLPIDFGQGCHRDTREHTPKVFGSNDSYSFSSPMNGYWHSTWGYVWHDVYSYNETTKDWEAIASGDYTMHTDTLGTPFATIWEHINYAEPFGATPNGPLVAEGVDYVGDFRSAHPELWCKKHNIILITDGETNSHEDCSNDAKDLVYQAYKAWHNDSIKVFAVGFGDGITDAGANQLNWTAFHGGTQSADSAFIDSMINEGMDTTRVSGDDCSMRDPDDTDDNFLTGYAYIANDASSLARSLKKIFSEIAGQKEKAFSSAEVTSIEEEFISAEYEARMYLATFYPKEGAFWDGHLRALRLVAGGLSLDDIPDSLVIWNAGNLLRNRDPSTRNIYGVKNGSLLSFNSSNFDSSDLDVPDDDVEDVINLVKSGSVVASDSAYLGDIFHSVPLRIGSPSYFFHDDDFDAYRDSLSAIRPITIYTGSNTGILHAFADSSGEELFGVVPENFIDQVKSLEDSHRFYVDANPVAADVWFPSTVNDSFKDWDEWKTVLFAAQGEGGRGMTCLDVTDPSSPSHLFSFDGDTFGLTTSVPVIHKIRRQIGAYTVERFFAFFGGGEWPEKLYDIYNPDSFVKGNVIVALDVYDAAENGMTYGSNYWFIHPSSGDMDYPFASAGNMLNLNPKVDNIYDRLYIPDLAGQLWRVDVTDPDVSDWTAQCIFQPPIPASVSEDSLWQPAYFRPIIERDPNFGCFWLYYGTGDRAKIFKDTVNNRFYAIMDTIDTSIGESYPLTESDLEKVSPSGSFDINNDFPSYKGWFIAYNDYGHTDEKTASHANLLLDTLTFVTFDPETSISTCSVSGGYAREYSVHFRTGALGGMKVIGSGVPQVPRYSFNIEGGAYEIHQTSDSVWVERKSGFGALKRVLQWKER